MSELANKTCIPCAGGTPPLAPNKVDEFLAQLDGWTIERDHHLTKTFTFPDFAKALETVNRIGEIAERQGHHPDLHLAWGLVRIELWTHKINGLTESDFILAAKVDALKI